MNFPATIYYITGNKVKKTKVHSFRVITDEGSNVIGENVFETKEEAKAEIKKRLQADIDRLKNQMQGL